MSGGGGAGLTPELVLVDPELAKAQRQTTHRKAAMSSPEPANGMFFVDQAQPAASAEPQITPLTPPTPAEQPAPPAAPEPVAEPAPPTPAPAAAHPQVSSTTPMVDVPLGTLIFRAGLLAEEQLEDALQEGMRTGKRLGEVLIERGWLHEKDLGRMLAGQKGLPFIEVHPADADPEALKALPEEKARLQVALPLRYEDGELVVAVADPSNELVIENLRRALGSEPKLVVAPYGELLRAIGEAYAAPPAPQPSPVSQPDPVPQPPLAAEPQPQPEAAPAPAPAPAPEVQVPPAPEPEPVQPLAAPTPLPTVVPPAEERTAEPATVPPLQPPAAEVVPEPVQAPAPAEVAPPVVPEAPAPLLQQPLAQPQPVAPLAPEALAEPVAPVAPVVEAQPAPPPAPPVAEAPAEPVPVAEMQPQPQPEPQPAPAPVAEHLVVLRLRDGETLQVGTFNSAAEASAWAQDVVRQIASAEGQSSWPFFADRYLRPDTIVSVDLVQESEEKWLGSSVRSRWAAAE